MSEEKLVDCCICHKPIIYLNDMMPVPPFLVDPPNWAHPECITKAT